MEYIVKGNVRFSVEMEIEADSHEEAEQIAYEDLKNYYLSGGDIVENSVDVTMDSEEIIEN